jgi:hypothetical protein
VIQGVLAHRSDREVEEVEPEALDFVDRQAVVGVGVDREADGVCVDSECVSQEPLEQKDHRRVRVHELQAVAPLAALGPVEHAAGLMKKVTLARPSTTLRLEHRSPRAAPRRPGRRATSLALGVLGALGTAPIMGLLLRRERDVARPRERGSGRDLQGRSDPLVGDALAPQFASAPVESEISRASPHTNKCSCRYRTDRALESCAQGPRSVVV